MKGRSNNTGLYSPAPSSSSSLTQPSSTSNSPAKQNIFNNVNNSKNINQSQSPLNIPLSQNNKTNVQLPPFILPAFPLVDSLAILIIILQFPPLVATITHILYLFISLTSPIQSISVFSSVSSSIINSSSSATTTSSSSSSSNTISQPSIYALLFADLAVAVLSLFLLPGLRFIIIDLSSAIIASSLAGGTITDRFKNAVYSTALIELARAFFRALCYFVNIFTMLFFSQSSKAIFNMSFLSRFPGFSSLLNLDKLFFSNNPSSKSYSKSNTLPFFHSNNSYSFPFTWLFFCNTSNWFSQAIAIHIIGYNLARYLKKTFYSFKSDDGTTKKNSSSSNAPTFSSINSSSISSNNPSINLSSLSSMQPSNNLLNSLSSSNVSSQSQSNNTNFTNNSNANTHSSSIFSLSAAAAVASASFSAPYDKSSYNSSSLYADGINLGSSTSLGNESSLASSKRRKREKAVRTQQPLWASLANTMVFAAKEAENTKEGDPSLSRLNSLDKNNSFNFQRDFKRFNSQMIKLLDGSFISLSNNVLANAGFCYISELASNEVIFEIADGDFSFFSQFFEASDSISTSTSKQTLDFKTSNSSCNWGEFFIRVNGILWPQVTVEKIEEMIGENDEKDELSEKEDTPDNQSENGDKDDNDDDEFLIKKTIISIKVSGLIPKTEYHLEIDREFKIPPLPLYEESALIDSDESGAEEEITSKSFKSSVFTNRRSSSGNNSGRDLNRLSNSRLEPFKEFAHKKNKISNPNHSGRVVPIPIYDVRICTTDSTSTSSLSVTSSPAASSSSTANHSKSADVTDSQITTSTVQDTASPRHIDPVNTLLDSLTTSFNTLSENKAQLKRSRRDNAKRISQLKSEIDALKSRVYLDDSGLNSATQSILGTPTSSIANLYAAYTSSISSVPNNSNRPSSLNGISGGVTSIQNNTSNNNNNTPLSNSIIASSSSAAAAAAVAASSTKGDERIWRRILALREAVRRAEEESAHFQEQLVSLEQENEMSLLTDRHKEARKRLTESREELVRLKENLTEENVLIEKLQSSHSSEHSSFESKLSKLTTRQNKLLAEMDKNKEKNRESEEIEQRKQIDYWQTSMEQKRMKRWAVVEEFSSSIAKMEKSINEIRVRTTKMYSALNIEAASVSSISSSTINNNNNCSTQTNSIIMNEKNDNDTDNNNNNDNNILNNVSSFPCDSINSLPTLEFFDACPPEEFFKKAEIPIN